MRGSTWLGCRRSGVQIAPPRPSVTNWFICNGRSWPAPRTCCDRWIPDAPVGILQLQFYLQSVSTNGSIWAFISEPRATVIFQQRVFSWSQGDSRQVQGGAISQKAVSGQCTKAHISAAIARALQEPHPRLGRLHTRVDCCRMALPSHTPLPCLLFLTRSLLRFLCCRRYLQSPIRRPFIRTTLLTPASVVVATVANASRL